MKRLMLSGVLALVAAMSASAATNYVNAANFGKDGLNGLTPETAFGTIQEAVDAAASGDTVVVAPGTYDQGGMFVSGDGTNRVVVTKPLTIISSGSAEDTFIVGADDPDSVATNSAYLGAGPAAVRCVYFSPSSVAGGYDAPVLKGFTITGGRSHFTRAAQGDALGGHPGGVTGDGSAYNFYVVDCRIEDNVGVRGGGMRYGTAVRCTITHNRTVDRSNSAARDIKAVHCLVVNNHGWTDLLNCTLVNCTLADSEAIVSDTSSDNLYNCVLQQSKTYAAGSKGLARNSVLSTHFSTDEADVVTDEPFPLFAPLCGDFRLRAGTAAIGLGDAKWIGDFFASAPAIVDVYRSGDGVVLSPTGSVNPGCYQSAVTAAGGAILMTDAVLAEGYVGYGKTLYAFSETAYDFLRVRGATGRKPLFALKRANGDGSAMFPEMDDSVWCMMPPAGAVLTNTPLYSATVVYVDPTGTDDASHGTATNNAVRTLQYAVSRISGYTTIYAAAGTYAEGQGTGASHNNRVATSGKDVRIKGAGAGKSFIVGASDTVCDDGRGPSALRCASLTSAPNGACLQGFTLCGGRSSGVAGSTTTTGSAYFGGAFYGETPRSQVIDCIVSNNVANRGSAIYGGVVRRSRIIDNLGYGDGCIYAAQLESSLVTANRGVRDVNSDCSTYSCTLASTNKRDVCGSQVAHANALILDVRNETSYHPFHVYDNMKGCLLDGYTYLADDTTSGVVSDHAIIAKANLADAAAGDFHATSDVDSPVFTAGCLPDDYWKRCLTDLEGRPFRIVNGRFPTGCFHYPEQAVTVTAGKWGTVTPSGRVIVPSDSGEISVSATASPDHRQILGFDVDGEFTPTTGDPACLTYRLHSGTVASGSVAITPVFSTNWYVNAAVGVGDDENSGFTADDPLQTLAQAMAYAASNDCVHVAEGVYASKSMPQGFPSGYGSNTYTPSRVDIAAGITVVADGARDLTIIEGQSADGAIGLGAVRCATVASGATLRGFTLRGGYTVDSATSGKNESDDVIGGGVLGQSTYALIENCVITNCHAVRGGGAARGTYRNCRIVDNRSTTDTAAMHGGIVYGCFFDQNAGGGWDLCKLYGVYNCTFTERNYGNEAKTSKSSRYLSKASSSAIPLVNSIVMGNSAQPVALDHSMTGSVTRATAGLDDNYVPIKGGASIDQGSDTLPAKLAATDLNGVQRVYNGRIDIGAFEYDWRGDYAAALGAGCTVTAATEKVTLTSDGVAIPEGASLTVEHLRQSDSARGWIQALLESDGALSVALDGTAAGSLAGPSPDVQTLKLRGLGTNSCLDFTYGGEGCAVLKSIDSRRRGFSLLFR